MGGKVYKMTTTNYGAELLRHIQTTEMCFECGREFDLFNEEEANEFINGHDCEA
jgi:hypothetical protein